jgi:hypothetical protein
MAGSVGSRGETVKLHFNNSTNQIRTWAFRSGFRSVFWGKQQPVFSMNQRAMEIQQGCGADGGPTYVALLMIPG